MLTIEHLPGIFWRRKISALLTFIVMLGAIAAVTLSLPNVYSSTSYVLVVSGGEGSGSDWEATQTNQVLLKTYAELLQTQTVAEDVAERLSFSSSSGAVQGSVAVSPIPQSQLIRVRAESSTARRAQELASTYVEVFVERADQLSEELDRSVTVAEAEPASLVDTPVRPRPKLYLLVGAVIAAACAAAVALLRERLDQRLEVSADTTEVLGLPIIARLPTQPRSPLPLLLDNADPGPRGAMLLEAFSLLLTNIAFLEEGRRPKSLVVLSAGEGEGKSTTCTGIGTAAAAAGARVLLIDGDLRRPQLTKMFGNQGTGAGFADLLDGAPFPTPEDIASEGIERVYMLPTGTQATNPVALLGAGLGRVDRWARQTFDLVLYDTPPVAVGADGPLIAATADAAILVIDIKQSRRGAIVQTIEQLKHVHAHVLGVVINRVDDVESAVAKSYYYRTGKSRRGRSTRRTSARS